MSMTVWAGRMYRNARKQARTRGIAFELTKEQFFDLVAKSNGRCTLTGIAFEFESAGFDKRRPFAPSLDRINNGEGYRLGNVRLVCIAVNVALNQWGDDVLLRMAKGLLGMLSEQDAAFRARPTATRLPGVVMRVNRAGVPKYHAYAKNGGRPEYRGAYATEFEAFTATRMTREQLAAEAEKSLLTGKGTVDRRRKYPKSLIL